MRKVIACVVMLILLPVYGLAPGHTHRVGRIPKITHPRSPEAAADFLKLRPTHTTISSKDPLPVLLMTAFFTMLAPVAALAVSGGGLDYAGTDISGKDFSNGNYKGKDFTQVLAKATDFSGSNLQGCRFYKAYLVRANFANADLRGASLEDTSMDDAILRNTVASGAYFSSSILDVQDLENADFTDAQFPLKTLPLLCNRADLKGTNPITGVDTRESLPCP